MSVDELGMGALATQGGKLRAASGGQRFGFESSPAYSCASIVWSSEGSNQFVLSSAMCSGREVESDP